MDLFHYNLLIVFGIMGEFRQIFPLSFDEFSRWDHMKMSSTLRGFLTVRLSLQSQKK